ncbi:hypothetical protein PIB30_116840 [Stylosanthes scabra]|uniref:Sas10 C-terminal domain-containing protein n=1 Tax=Stylosanthes scabra TaxID=79078 RepID=A0ABU6QBP5_9FABA|nr:hypothetical protein [Stylosanthes scabra]
MGKKGGGKSFPNKNKAIKNDKKSSRRSFEDDDMDDEIDAFNKERDFVPFHNADDEESDEDDAIPVLDKDIGGSEDEDSDDDGEEEEDDDDDDADDDLSKMIRQRKYLRAKFGTGEDDMPEDEEEEDEDNKLTWGGKRFAHGAENRNFELQSSDDEDLKEEEKLALQQQKDKAKNYTMEDYGLADISEGKDDEMTLEDASDKKGAVSSPDRDITLTVEDLNALSKEEQMNILHRSAPDLVGWLSELNDAHEQLEAEVNPFLSKVKSGELDMEGAVRYFELKQLLLLSYCQAITFYLLLKSEGQPVHDHPVMARLEEIKNLLDQIKQLDTELPFELEDILKGNNGLEAVPKNAPTTINSLTKEPFVSAKSLEEMPKKSVEAQKFQSVEDNVQKSRKDKHQKDSIGVQSLEMLKVRASLEEKLKQKGLYSSIAPKPNGDRKRSRPVNGRLETYDDFVDDMVDIKGAAGLVNGSNKVTQYLNANLKKPKVISGDDDLPKRDDIGERRRKHELRVLAGAGVQNEDDNGDDYDNEVGRPGSDDDDANEEDDFDSGDSENEFYKQVEQQRAAKLAAKSQIYSRKSGVEPSMPETVEGKRQITSQMAKNRGLTRIRNKAKKNPRKNYKLKHQKALKKRQGQVQSIRKPAGPYGGEATGINPFVSRSIRFKD